MFLIFLLFYGDSLSHIPELKNVGNILKEFKLNPINIKNHRILYFVRLAI